jgi:hypothetical protein
VTVVSATLKDVIGHSDKMVWIFKSATLREGLSGDIITTRSVRVTPVDGVLTADLEPGLTEVTYLGKTYTIVVPVDGPVDLWDLLSAEVIFEGIRSADVGIAVSAYLDGHVEDVITEAVGNEIVDRDLIEGDDPRIGQITELDEYPVTEADENGRLSRFVDQEGHTWIRLHESVDLPGDQIEPGSITGDKFDSSVTLPQADTSHDVSFQDETGRLSELTIDNGRFPQWVVDGFVGRASSASFSPYPRRHSLKLDGTGDYSSLAAAVAALGAGSERSPIELVIYPGTHTAYQVYVPDWWILRGTNKGLCRLHGETADSGIDDDVNKKSTLQLEANHELHNLTITARNMRYPIHDEAAGAVTDGTVVVKNCHIEHLGNQGARDWRNANPGSGLLASTVFNSETPWGYGTSSGNIRKFIDTTFIGRASGWYIHDNQDFERPTEHDFENCEIASTRPTAVASIEIQSLGSGQWSRVSMRGTGASVLCVSYSDSPYISVADDNQLSAHSQIEVSIDGLDPLGFQTTHRGKALKIESSSTATTSTVRVSGTGAAAIFGQPTIRDGGGGLKGYIYGQWDISGILCGLNNDTAAKNTLGKRLGDCSTVSKTLSVTVDGGSAIDIVFNTDLTAVSNATIISTINSALSTAATASEYLVTQGEVYPRFTSRIKRLVNQSATGIPRWSAVKLDTTRGIALMAVTDPVELFYGVALENIAPNAIGRLLTSGRLQTASQMAGLSTSPIAGAPIFFSDSTAGAFSLTGTRQAAVVQYVGWATFEGSR